MMANCFISFLILSMSLEMLVLFVSYEDVLFTGFGSCFALGH